MKKTEVRAFGESVKRVPGSVLKKAVFDCGWYEDERHKTRSMYFWTDNGNSYERDRRCDYLSIRETTKIGRHEIAYGRNVDQSRKHTYAKDWITLDGADITVGDLKKLAAEMQAIIDRREEKQNRPKRPAHRPSKAPSGTVLAELYKTKTQKEIAELYQVSIRTAARWLHFAGIRKAA